jgi:hypothetical protein
MTRRTSRRPRGDHFRKPLDEFEAELIERVTRMHEADRIGDDE